MLGEKNPNVSISLLFLICNCCNCNFCNCGARDLSVPGETRWNSSVWTEVSWEVGIGNLQVGKKRNGSLVCVMSELHQPSGITASVARVAFFCFHLFCLARKERTVLGKSVVTTPEHFLSCGHFWCLLTFTWLSLICSLSV